VATTDFEIDFILTGRSTAGPRKASPYSARLLIDTTADFIRCCCLAASAKFVNIECKCAGSSCLAELDVCGPCAPLSGFTKPVSARPGQLLRAPTAPTARLRESNSRRVKSPIGLLVEMSPSRSQHPDNRTISKHRESNFCFQ